MIEISVFDQTPGMKRQIDIVSDQPGKVTIDRFIKDLKQILIQTSIQVLREEQARGFEKVPRVRVDGRFDRDLRLVKPFGKIEFFAKQEAKQAIMDIYTEIQKRSIIDTGLYFRSNYVFHNQALVATTRLELRAYLDTATFRANDFIRFVNVTPYAARLEVNGYRKEVRGPNRNKSVRSLRKSKKTGKLVNLPNGAYFLAWRVAKRKYRSIANFISFTFMSNGTDGIKIPDLGPGLRNAYQPRKRPKRPVGSPYFYPSITLRLFEGGFE